MKKISMIAILTLVAVMISACGGKAPASSYENSLEVINTVWDAYDENDKFPAGGGDSANLNMEGPAKFDHTNKDELDVTLGLPADLSDKIDDAASLMHMMNANNFTAGIYRLTKGTDSADFAAAWKANLDQRRWMCGFPEKFLVVGSGNYVIAAFGHGQIIDTFKKTATDNLENAEVILEGAIEG